MKPQWSLLVAACIVLTACSSGTSEVVLESDTTAPTTTEPTAPTSATASVLLPVTPSEEFPDIIGVQATPDGSDAGETDAAGSVSWRFDVTVSSPYDTPERYADAWRVVGLDGTEYGIRVLTHDHASEQPFTRSESGILIPADVTTVMVEGRDLVNGWGGGSLIVELSP